MLTSKASNALVVAGLFAVVATTSAWAGVFTNWPTYASSASNNWPTADEYRELTQDLTWSYHALVERSEVVGVGTTGIAPKTDGVRLPETDIERMKDHVEVLIPKYVDHSQEGSFTNLSEFPVLTETGVMAELSLPADFLDATPYSRHLNDVLPFGVTTNYGMPGLKDSILELKWTGRHCQRADMGNHAAQRQERGSSCAVKHDTWTQARMCALNTYSNGWQTNSGTYYYRLARGLGYSPNVYVGWIATAWRNRSTPQCPSITVPDGVYFSWDAYLKPQQFNNTCGVSYDGYSGWAQNKLRKWDAGGPVSTNTVQAFEIGGEDETFPFFLDPELNNDNRTTNGVQIEVRDFYWLLKWEFLSDDE